MNIEPQKANSEDKPAKTELKPSAELQAEVKQNQAADASQTAENQPAEAAEQKPPPPKAPVQPTGSATKATTPAINKDNNGVGGDLSGPGAYDQVVDELVTSGKYFVSISGKGRRKPKHHRSKKGKSSKPRISSSRAKPIKILVAVASLALIGFLGLFAATNLSGDDTNVATSITRRTTTQTQPVSTDQTSEDTVEPSSADSSGAVAENREFINLGTTDVSSGFWFLKTNKIEFNWDLTRVPEVEKYQLVALISHDGDPSFNDLTSEGLPLEESTGVQELAVDHAPDTYRMMICGFDFSAGTDDCVLKSDIVTIGESLPLDNPPQQTAENTQNTDTTQNQDSSTDNQPKSTQTTANLEGLDQSYISVSSQNKSSGFWIFKKHRAEIEWVINDLEDTKGLELLVVAESGRASSGRSNRDNQASAQDNRYLEYAINDSAGTLTIELPKSASEYRFSICVLPINSITGECELTSQAVELDESVEATKGSFAQPTTTPTPTTNNQTSNQSNNSQTTPQPTNTEPTDQSTEPATEPSDENIDSSITISVEDVSGGFWFFHKNKAEVRYDVPTSSQASKEVIYILASTESDPSANFSNLDSTHSTEAESVSGVVTMTLSEDVDNYYFQICTINTEVPLLFDCSVKSEITRLGGPVNSSTTSNNQEQNTSSQPTTNNNSAPSSESNQTNNADDSESPQSPQNTGADITLSVSDSSGGFWFFHKNKVKVSYDVPTYDVETELIFVVARKDGRFASAFGENTESIAVGEPQGEVELTVSDDTSEYTYAICVSADIAGFACTRISNPVEI